MRSNPIEGDATPPGTASADAVPPHVAVAVTVAAGPDGNLPVLKPSCRLGLLRSIHPPKWKVITRSGVMRSFAVGQMVKSRNPTLAHGQLAQGLFGWSDYIIARPGTPSGPAPVSPGVPIETAMSALGLTRVTAYFGLLEGDCPQPGETVVVSGAAGATGSAVGQIATIKGCRAIGITGGADKCKIADRRASFAAAIDYKSEDVAARLRETCSQGIDVSAIRPASRPRPFRK